MGKNRSNFLQKKNPEVDDKGVKYVADKMKENNAKTRIVEITPRLSSIDIKQDLSFDDKVEQLANLLKDRILQLYKEGNSVRYIASQVDMSRESVRKTIKGECSLKILAMERVRAQESLEKMQKLNF